MNVWAGISTGTVLWIIEFSVGLLFGAIGRNILTGRNKITPLNLRNWDIFVCPDVCDSAHRTADLQRVLAVDSVISENVKKKKSNLIALWIENNFQVLANVSFCPSPYHFSISILLYLYDSTTIPCLREPAALPEREFKTTMIVFVFWKSTSSDKNCYHDRFRRAEIRRACRCWDEWNFYEHFGQKTMLWQLVKSFLSASPVLILTQTTMEHVQPSSDHIPSEALPCKQPSVLAWIRIRSHSE